MKVSIEIDEHLLTEGDVVKVFRHIKRLDQHTLGTLIGRSQNWVCGVERGRILLSNDELHTLYRFLDVPEKLILRIRDVKT